MCSLETVRTCYERLGKDIIRGIAKKKKKKKIFAYIWQSQVVSNAKKICKINE
jgi:hypothetical protein